LAAATTTTVTVLGSADTFNAGGFGNSCFLVQDARGAFCVDFGPTALLALKRRGFDPNDLDAVALTHLHGDHFGGLQQLFIDAQYCSRRRRPLIVAGPVGTRRKVEALYRLAYGRCADQRAYQTRYVEWAPGDVGRFAGWQVQTLRAEHMRPRDGALSLRIRTRGGKRALLLAFSGDTAWSERLVALARGADLFVCECTEIARTEAKHLSWEELEPRLPLLEARRILLTHLGESVRRRQRRLAAPRVRLAEDGLVLRLGSAAG